MSMLLMVKAMSLRLGNPLRKLVLLKLADNANDLGECWPSYQHIADQCEIGRSTVKAHIRALSEAGFLVVESRNDGKSSNRYVLTLDEGVQVERGVRSRERADSVSDEPGQDLTRSAVDSTRSAADPQTRSAADPITSHLSEPVIEPVCSPPPDDPLGFDDWWELYPKKVARKPCLEIWRRKRLGDRAGELIDRLRRQVGEDDQWASGYVPHPKTYLNQERWDDEINQKPFADGDSKGSGRSFKGSEAQSGRAVSAVDAVRQRAREKEVERGERPAGEGEGRTFDGSPL